ncbi:MAG: N-acetylmuramoyl-L-alanine amidase [Bacteroidetes bacterium]|nr:N-acetylmuramoyl-L-alanine amidase [Bacteroidota bacterium]
MSSLLGRIPLALCVFALGLAQIRVSAAQPTLLREITVVPRKDGQGYVVRFHTNRLPREYSWQMGPAGHIRILLPQVRLARFSPPAAPIGPVRSIRLHKQGSTLRVELALDPTLPVRPALYPDAERPHLLLGLTLTTPEAPAPTAQHSAPSAAPTPQGEVSKSRWSLDVVAIDPGHGGHDAGAVYHGVREKDITLGIAERLGRMLEQELGLRVVHTRTDDRFVDLYRRGQIANEAGAKLFISIHANVSPSSRHTRGTETYFMGLHKTEEARRVMERENAVIRLEADPERYRDFTEEQLIIHTLAQSAFLREAERLAELVEKAFAAQGRPSRGVKQAGFVVLWRPSMPSILVEVGFLSNPEEARWLASSEGQESVARAIFRAVAQYKLRYERALQASFAADSNP